jgi:DNA modification methylase
MIKMIHGDCIEYMKTMTDKIDVVITDPPFNAGKSFDNDNLSFDEWEKFCYDFSNAIKKHNPLNVLCEISKKDIVMQYALDKNFKRKWIIVLNYTNAMRNGGVGFSNTGIVLYYGGKVFKRYMDRIDSPLHNTKKLFQHPSPKEIIHYQKLVEMFSKENMTVFDPFTGSGTTGIACHNLNRNFIGIEKEKKYYDIAVKRIEDSGGNVIQHKGVNK